MITTFVLTLILLLAIGMPAPASVQAAPMPADSVRAALLELDEAIARKPEYRARKEARIADLRRRLHYAVDTLEQYALCEELFDEYLHYQADSAVHYLNRRLQLLPSCGQDDLKARAYIDRAAVMGVTGMYAAAVEVLTAIPTERLKPETLVEYYRACRSCYGWMADYSLAIQGKRRYMEQTDRYRDSILLVDNPVTADIARAERAALGGKAEEAVAILRKYLPGDTDDLETLSYLNYTMYEAYVAKGDTARQVYYLARTAVHDMERSVREYASLHKLARLLHEQGDLDRAYAYLNCSMEDAVACHARLRSLEVTEIYPIIDRAYHDKEAHRPTGACTPPTSAWSRRGASRRSTSPATWTAASPTWTSWSNTAARWRSWPWPPRPTRCSRPSAPTSSCATSARRSTATSTGPSSTSSRASWSASTTSCRRTGASRPRRASCSTRSCASSPSSAWA